MDFNNTIFPDPSFNYGTLANFQNDVIYIPINKDKYNKANNKPTSSSYSNKEITSDTNSNFIPCIFLPANRGKPTNNFLVMFHGNGEDIFLSHEMADGLRQKLEMNVLLVEYPGYSLYKADKNSQTILEDSLYIYEFIKKEFKNVKEENIFVYGRSIGSAPAIYVASQKKVAALFLVSAFTSIRAVVKNMVGPLCYLVKNRFLSIDYIKNVQCPIYFIHGKIDTLIPYTETVKLFDSCSHKEQNEYRYPEGMTHNDYDLREDILEPIRLFIKNKNLLKPSEGTVFPDYLFKMPNSVLADIKKNKGSEKIINKNEYYEYYDDDI